jgi:sugar/nucleoside kinase (ribokinase family)
VADSRELDVVGIGNALVDVLTHAEEGFLARQSLVKGTMHLVDEPRARELYDAMGPGVEMSGGSAANTVVGVASFGGRAHYVGKVRDDQLGEVFGHDLRATGVGYDTPRATEGPPTGRCLILVTPDAQRTMSTFLGASVRLGPGDIDKGPHRPRKILYLEGYLFDPPEGPGEAFRGRGMAHAAGAQGLAHPVGPFCVGGIARPSSTWSSITWTSSSPTRRRSARCTRSTVRRRPGPRAGALRDRRAHPSAKGSVDRGRRAVPHGRRAAVDAVVDTTGAGDLCGRRALWPQPGPRPADLRAARLAGRRRGHRPRGRPADGAPGAARGP